VRESDGAVCRHLLRATRKGGDGLAMEVLDRRSTDTAWHGVRSAVLQGTAQEQGQQRSDPGSGAGSTDAHSLAVGLPGFFPTEALMFPTFGKGERKEQAVP
jgi:hypothetical protein